MALRLLQSLFRVDWRLRCLVRKPVVQYERNEFAGMNLKVGIHLLAVSLNRST